MWKIFVQNYFKLIIIILLLLSIPIGIYLAQKTQIFKPRAVEELDIGAGSEIFTCTQQESDNGALRTQTCTTSDGRVGFQGTEYDHYDADSNQYYCHWSICQPLPTPTTSPISYTPSPTPLAVPSPSPSSSPTQNSAGGYKPPTTLSEEEIKTFRSIGFYPHEEAGVVYLLTRQEFGNRFCNNTTTPLPECLGQIPPLDKIVQNDSFMLDLIRNLYDKGYCPVLALRPYLYDDPNNIIDQNPNSEIYQLFNNLYTKGDLSCIVGPALNRIALKTSIDPIDLNSAISEVAQKHQIAEETNRVMTTLIDVTDVYGASRALITVLALQRLGSQASRESGINAALGITTLGIGVVARPIVGAVMKEIKINIKIMMQSISESRATAAAQNRPLKLQDLMQNTSKWITRGAKDGLWNIYRFKRALQTVNNAYPGREFELFSTQGSTSVLFIEKGNPREIYKVYTQGSDVFDNERLITFTRLAQAEAKRLALLSDNGLSPRVIEYVEPRLTAEQRVQFADSSYGLFSDILQHPQLERIQIPVSTRLADMPIVKMERVFFEEDGLYQAVNSNAFFLYDELDRIARILEKLDFHPYDVEPVVVNGKILFIDAAGFVKQSNTLVTGGISVADGLAGLLEAAIARSASFNNQAIKTPKTILSATVEGTGIVLGKWWRKIPVVGTQINTNVYRLPFVYSYLENGSLKEKIQYIDVKHDPNSRKPKNAGHQNTAELVSPSSLSFQCLNNNTVARVSWSGNGQGYDIRVEGNGASYSKRDCPPHSVCVNNHNQTSIDITVSPNAINNLWLTSTRVINGVREESQVARLDNFRCPNVTLKKPQVKLSSCNKTTLNLSWTKSEDDTAGKGIVYAMRGVNTDDSNYYPTLDGTINGAADPEYLKKLGENAKKLIGNNFGDDVSCLGNICSYSRSGLDPSFKYRVWVSAVTLKDGKVNERSENSYFPTIVDCNYREAGDANEMIPQNMTASCQNGRVTFSWDGTLVAGLYPGAPPTDYKYNIRGIQTEDKDYFPPDNWTDGVDPKRYVTNGNGDINCQTSTIGTVGQLGAKGYAKCTYTDSQDIKRTGTYRLWVNSYKDKNNDGAFNRDTEIRSVNRYMEGLVSCN